MTHLSKWTPKMVTCECAWCHVQFQARTVDVKRGWGKFCCKSHKAMAQAKSMGPSGKRKIDVARTQRVKAPKTEREIIDASFAEWDAIVAREDAEAARKETNK